MKPSIHRLLKPRSVAIVGASAEPLAIGNNALTNITGSAFDGNLHLVSRNSGRIDGRTCRASIDELPEGIDVALLVVPAHAVADAMAACVRRKLGAVVVFAAGFGEIDEAGRAQQASLAATARHAGMVMMGPNCLGLVNFVDGLPLTFEPVRVEKENRPGACVISQSGAMAGNVRMALTGRGTPVAYALATGNEAALSATDLIEHLLPDPAVSMFTLLLEQITDPQPFLQQAERANQLGKPIAMLHVGRGERSREATQTHTGALASDHAVMSACVAAAGVVLVPSLDELFDVASILARYPHPHARGPAIVTNSGALRGVALDFAEEIRLELPRLDTETVQVLEQRLPTFATVDNPLDVTAQAMRDPALFAVAAQAVLSDPNVGGLIVAAMGGGPAQQRGKWDALRPTLAAADKPAALAFLGDGAELDAAVVSDVRASGVPYFRSVDRALRAWSCLARAARHVQREPCHAAQPGNSIGDVKGRAGPVVEHDVKSLLAAAGIPVPCGRLATTPIAAKAVACEIGYPLVLKAQAATLMHKSDVGGIALGIRNDRDLSAAWERVAMNVSAKLPALRLEGMLVEHMTEGDHIEMIVGARRDPAWGPVLLVGLGGIWAETLKDTKTVPCNAGRQGIEVAISELKGRSLLAGARGRPPSDVDALVRTLSTIAGMMLANTEISEIEINPLAVFPAGRGVVALDAVMVIGPP